MNPPPILGGEEVDMIITRTPLRISFFGGGTDYPAWYRENGGAVLTTSIDKYCYINCRHQPPFFESRYRIAYRNIELCMNRDEIKHPSVRACLSDMNIREGVEIVYAGDLPARSGLGSSSSFTVGLVNALYALQGKMISKGDLAKKAIHIEQNVIGEPVGSQDQIIAAHGGLKLISFNNDIIVQPVVLSPARLELLQNHLMLFYTGTSRYGAVIAQDKIENMPRRQGELRRIHELVYEALEVLTSGSNISEFGGLLQESWLLKRSLSEKVSTPGIDGLYDIALASGAIGGKLLGAGGGGFLLFFVPQERRKHLKTALQSLLHVPFSFEHDGSKVILFDNSKNTVSDIEDDFELPSQERWAAVAGKAL